MNYNLNFYHFYTLSPFTPIITVKLPSLVLNREIKAEHPMLDFTFFKNPRFSTGAGAIAIGFFALFGTIFGLTQYLQFVKNYTPLEAGLRMVPVALGIAIGAGFSHRLVDKLGTNKVVAMGLIILAGVLCTITTWQPDTDYWIIGLSFFIMAFGMSNLMAPSTDSVMGAVPEASTGIASAMNDRNTFGSRRLRCGRHRLRNQHSV